MNDVTLLNQNSQSWMFFVKTCFAVSVVAMATAIVFLPTMVWVKGYLAMGSLLLVASSFMLSKSIRDDFEARKVINRLSEAKAEHMLREFDRAA